MVKSLLIILLILGICAGVYYVATNDELIDSITSYEVVYELLESANELLEPFSDYLPGVVDESIEERILKAWENLDETIDVSAYKINTDDISGVYNGVIADNPCYYYVESAFEYIYNDKYVKKIKPSYSENDKTVIAQELEKIDSATKQILSYISADLDDFAKVMTVHDYMVLNYSYDNSLSNHSISIMHTKTGVCESYARAFKHVMDEVGIECKIVESDEMMHSWNLVKIDGDWYHIDLTMDDPIEDKYAQVSHEYALLSSYTIDNADTPHYGYDLAGLSADSDKYDYASWRSSLGAIVTIDGINYWTENGSLVSSQGDIIYSNLDGGDGLWNISALSGYSGVCLSGLGVHGGILYFNTDSAIMSYNPTDRQINTVSYLQGVCGLFVYDGILFYSNSDGSGGFGYCGEISLA